MWRFVDPKAKMYCHEAKKLNISSLVYKKKFVGKDSMEKWFQLWWLFFNICFLKVNTLLQKLIPAFKSVWGSCDLNHVGAALFTSSTNENWHLSIIFLNLETKRSRVWLNLGWTISHRNSQHSSCLPSAMSRCIVVVEKNALMHLFWDFFGQFPQNAFII